MNSSRKQRKIILPENKCEILLFVNIPMRIFEISHRYIYMEDPILTKNKINKIATLLSKPPRKLGDAMLQNLLVERLLRDIN